MNAEMFGRTSVIFVALTFLQITKHASAQNPTVSSNTTAVPSASSTASSPPSVTPAPSQSYLTLPSNLKVELGDPAQFWCGVPKSSKGLTFTFYGHVHNYTLSCPSGHVEDIPQALKGLCIVHSDQLLGGWLLKGTSIPDDGSRAVCQRRGYPAAPTAHLHVHNNGSGNALLIGLAVGGFFGVLTVCGLFYLMLTKSERLRICFRGKDNQPDDLIEIVDVEATAASWSQPTLNEKMRDL